MLPQKNLDFGRSEILSSAILGCNSKGWTTCNQPLPVCLKPSFTGEALPLLSNFLSASQHMQKEQKAASYGPVSGIAYVL